MTQVLRGEQYPKPKRGSAGPQGFASTKTGRLFVTSNRRSARKPFGRTRSTIYRSANASAPWQLEPYFRVCYPWGIGGFQHGVSHIAQGTDGVLYVTSGSRTDGNEPGKDPRYFKGGEVDTTACLWRIDPDNSKAPEIFARGLLNSFGFAGMTRWSDFATGERA